METATMHTRAMLVSLRLSSWSARKYDRKISAETAAAHNTTLDAGRYNKHLLPGDAPAYKALNSHISAMRELHYANTLAWSDDGWRLLPVRNFQKYTDAMRTAQHEYNRLLDEFAVAYPGLRADARLRLNGMYSDTDYPTDVRGRYSFGIEFNPVPSGNDFRVTLTADEISTIAARTEERVKEAFEAAHKDAVTRLYEAVSKIQERLSQPEAIFRDSLIENARELCDVLGRLNLADDLALDELRRQTELLAASEPETLRRDVSVRLDTANRAQTILDAMTATYGGGLIA